MLQIEKMKIANCSEGDLHFAIFIFQFAMLLFLLSLALPRT